MVDRECDKYHKEKGLSIRDDLPYVKKLSSDPLEHDRDEHIIDTRLQVATDTCNALNDIVTEEINETYEEEHERIKRSSVSSGEVNSQ